MIALSDKQLDQIKNAALPVTAASALCLFAASPTRSVDAQREVMRAFSPPIVA
jgi:hypothetical protein